MSTPRQTARLLFCRCGAVMSKRRTMGDEPVTARTMCRGCRHRERQRAKAEQRELDRAFKFLMTYQAETEAAVEAP